MAWLGNTNHTFHTIADTLIAEDADDSTLHDVLAALMDHVGVPMMLAEHYRDVPTIRALFAERGVTLLDPDGPRAEPCRCAAPDVDPDSVTDDQPEGVCVCGHVPDEHDDRTGECLGLMV